MNLSLEQIDASIEELETLLPQLEKASSKNIPMRMQAGGSPWPAVQEERPWLYLPAIKHMN